MNRTGSLVAGLVCLAVATGCAAFWKDARTALNVTEQACVLAQPVEASVPAIVDACNIVEALYPELNQLLSAKRSAMVLKAVEQGASR